MIRGMFAYGFIINLPDKYNAKGGRESTQLSDGRKQIVVASCINSIKIEATSANQGGQCCHWSKNMFTGLKLG